MILELTYDQARRLILRLQYMIESLQDYTNPEWRAKHGAAKGPIAMHLLVPEGSALEWLRHAIEPHPVEPK